MLGIINIISQNRFEKIELSISKQITWLTPNLYQFTLAVYTGPAGNGNSSIVLSCLSVTF